MVLSAVEILTKTFLVYFSYLIFGFFSLQAWRYYVFIQTARQNWLGSHSILLYRCCNVVGYSRTLFC